MQYHNINIFENYPLKDLITLRVGGRARYFVSTTSEAELLEALAFATEKDLPMFVLGGGSNVVVSDSGFPGLVILNSITGYTEKSENGKILIRAGAGEDWDNIVKYTVEKNLAGVECLSGIPGKAGGAPIQNINAYGQNAGDVIREVRVVEIATKQVKTLTKEQCGFEYRKSIFNTTEKNKYIVDEITLELTPNGAATLKYEYVVEYFKNKNITKPSLGEVREAVLELRRKRGHTLDSGGLYTAGSFFKNANSLEQEKFKTIETIVLRDRDRIPLNCCPDPWHWKLPDGKEKIASACLVHCSEIIPGTRQERVGTSPKQTLAIMNYENATAHEIMLFAKKIRDTVYQKFGIIIEIEPELIGFTNEELESYLKIT